MRHMGVLGYLLLPALILLFSSRSAYAFDGTTTGVLKYVHVKTTSTTQTLVLELNGSPTLCGTSSPAVGVVPSTATAFTSMVSVATSALLAGKGVVLYADLDTSTGLCVVKQIRLNG
jgi:hypothetical protein